MKLQSEVLIMDDEVLFREPFRKKLKRGGFTVCTALSSRHAIELAKKKDLDAAVLDIRMSEGGSEGLDAVKALRRLKKNLYLEVLTAHKEYKRQAIELGADAVVFKPEGVRGDAPVGRISQGILSKRLEAFSDLTDSDGDVIYRKVTPDDEPSSDLRPRVAMRASVLGECAQRVDSFLSANKKQYGLSEEGADDLREDLLRLMMEAVAVGSPGCMTESDREGAEEGREYIDDYNLKKYETLEPELRTKYPGQFVAICRGKLVARSGEKATVFDLLAKEYPMDPCLVRQVDLIERVVQFRRPWRKLKDSIR